MIKYVVRLRLAPPLPLALLLPPGSYFIARRSPRRNVRAAMHRSYRMHARSSPLDKLTCACRLWPRLDQVPVSSSCHGEKTIIPSGPRSMDMGQAERPDVHQEEVFR